MTLTSIILAGLLSGTAAVLARKCYVLSVTRKKLDKTYKNLDDYLNDQNATDARYSITKIGKGRGVFRSTAYSGRIGEAVIKWFDTDDESFNQREAEELCDKLNE